MRKDTKIFEGLKRLTGQRGLGYALIGVIGDKATAQKTGGDLTVVQVAEIHEFGAGHVPQRSFIRSTMNANRTEYQKRMDAAIKKTLESGEIENYKEGLGTTAEKYRGDVIMTIRNRIAPELKTRKGGVPLWDTGQLVGSIAVEIKEE